jgi:hypothetical protein
LSRKTSIIFLTQKNSSTYTNGGETKMKPKTKIQIFGKNFNPVHSFTNSLTSEFNL